MQKNTLYKIYDHLEGRTPLDIISEFKTSEINKVEKKYHIKVNDDGTVFDNDTSQCYDNLLYWAKVTVELFRETYEAKQHCQ